MEITASRRLSSISVLRTALCAFDEPKSTPSGTIQAHLPPTFSIRKNSVRNSNSVFFVLQTFSKSGETMSLSRLPLNGGLARISEYISLSGFCSERLSRYSIEGLAIPCVIMFIAPIRSIVLSMSYP